MKIRLLAGAAVMMATAVSSQTTSVAPDVTALAKGDPNRIVCKSEETIGTRLGARKVCLTAQQWVDKYKEHREFTEGIQTGARARPSS